MPIVILAHGGLGSFDEVIFVSVAIIFVGMMAVSWFRSQQLPEEEVDAMADENIVRHQEPNPEHFELD
jgi:hypothetical protein